MTNGEDMGPGKDVPPWLQPVPEDETTATPAFANKFMILTVVGAVVVIALFVAVILYLYDGTKNQPPLRVAAPSGEVKEKPADPGGMQVAHQDKEIFEQSDGMKPRSQVSLGAQPEKPLEDIPEDPLGDVIEATEQAQSGAEAESSVSSPTIGEPAPAEAAVSEQPSQPEPAAPEDNSTTEAPTQSTEAPPAQPDMAVYRVQLGAYGSRDGASRAWRAIRAKFPRDLRNVLPSYEAVQSGDRTLFRLRVGPYISRAAADQVCLALRANEQACIVVNP